MAIIKPPEVGQMRFVIRFENPVKPADDAGGHTEDYEEFANVRGYVEKDNRTEDFVEGTHELVSRWKMFVWWRRAWDSFVTKDTRIVYDNRFFKIVSREPVNQIRGMMYFTLINVE